MQHLHHCIVSYSNDELILKSLGKTRVRAQPGAIFLGRAYFCTLA
jgi:hypothetical protein